MTSALFSGTFCILPLWFSVCKVSCYCFAETAACLLFPFDILMAIITIFWEIINYHQQTKAQLHSFMEAIIQGRLNKTTDNYMVSGQPIGSMGHIGRPETSVWNYHYSLRNNLEQRSSHLTTCHFLDRIYPSQRNLNLRGSRCDPQHKGWERNQSAIVSDCEAGLCLDACFKSYHTHLNFLHDSWHTIHLTYC